MKIEGRGETSTFWYNALMKITFLSRVIAAVGLEIEEGNELAREHVSLFDEDPPVQAQPFSTVQVLLHPSPLTVLPSSQARTYLLLSPQVYLQKLEKMLFVVDELREKPEEQDVQIVLVKQFKQ